MESTSLNFLSDPDQATRDLLEITKTADGGFHDLLCDPPPRANSNRLAWAILRSLGKEKRVQRPPQKKERWELVQIWLRAEQIRRLFIISANYLTSDAVEALEELREKMRIDIWLLDPSGDVTWNLQYNVKLTPWGIGGFESRQKEIRRDRRQEQLSEEPLYEERDPVHDLPELSAWPETILKSSALGFPVQVEGTFGDRKKAVAAVKKDFHLTFKMIGAPPWLRYPDDQPIDGELLLRRLRFALTTASTEVHALIRLKAAQAAALQHRRFLVHPSVVTCMKSSLFHPGLPRLKAFSKPRDALLGLVSFSTGLAFSDLLSIRGFQGHYEFEGMPIAIPQGCQSILDAAELEDRHFRSDETGVKRPLFGPNRTAKWGDSYVSHLFKQMIRIEDCCRIRVQNRSWPARWGYRAYASS